MYSGKPHFVAKHWYRQGISGDPKWKKKRQKSYHCLKPTRDPIKYHGCVLLFAFFYEESCTTEDDAAADADADAAAAADDDDDDDDDAAADDDDDDD